MKADLYIEFNNKKTDHKVILEKAKETWKEQGNKLKDLNNVELYFKPEESKCYYVFNGDSDSPVSGAFDI